MTAVATVVFDAGMTLVRAEPTFGAAFAGACAERGVVLRAEEVDAADHLWRDHHDRWQSGGNPSPWAGDTAAEAGYFRALYQRFLSELGADSAPEVVDHVLTRLSDPESYGAFPEVAAVLADLARRGVRLGVVSNWGTTLPLRRVLQRAGIAGRFATVVVSGEEGVAKPEHEIFLRALQRLGVGAGPAVAYVGDDPYHDVAPARRLGLAAVLVDRSGVHPGHDGPRVTDLSGLFDVLPLPAAGR